MYEMSDQEEMAALTIEEKIHYCERLKTDLEDESAAFEERYRIRFSTLALQLRTLRAQLPPGSGGADDLVEQPAIPDAGHKAPVSTDNVFNINGTRRDSNG